MKKRLLAALLATISILCLAGCGGKVSNVGIREVPSDIYTFKEIDDAATVVMNYFRQNFDGCELTELWYAGDEEKAQYDALAARYGAEAAIVLKSTFTTGRSGGDGSLNPNDTYENWKWILIRDKDGAWSHADHGYG